MTSRTRLRQSVTAALALALGQTVFGPVTGATQSLPDIADLVVVTEDTAKESRGCDAASVFDITDGSPVHRGRTHISPGRLAASRDLSLIVASHTNTQRFLYTLNRAGDDDYTRWSTGTILGSEVATFGGVAVLDSTRELLVGTASVDEQNSPYLPNEPPYAVAKYSWPSSFREGARIGVRRGYVRTDAVPVEIALVDDQRIAHVVTARGTVMTIDTLSLTETQPAISTAGVEGWPDRGREGPVNFLDATLSPDERYMVVNRGHVPEIAVADLVGRRAWTLALPPDLEWSGGVAVDRSGLSDGLLAVHSHDFVVVFQFKPHGPLVEVGRARVSPPLKSLGAGDKSGPKLSVAWSGNAGKIIAAVDESPGEFAVLGVENGGSTLRHLDPLVACGGSIWPNDILTANGLIPTATPTATATVTPASTATATLPTPTPTREPPSTPKPKLLYMPLALHEVPCSSQRLTAVALVVDTSSSMLERTSTGRTKLEVAVDAAGAFIDVLTFPQDQAAVIGFDGDVVVHELTSDASTLHTALAGLESEPGTDIAAGVEAAHGELTSPRRRPENFPAMVLLTDGQANAGPQPAIVAAKAAKADGVYIFTIGLGDTIDRDQLRAMASEPAWFYEAATAEDLAAVYAAIAVDLPCPSDRYWGRR